MAGQWKPVGSCLRFLSFKISGENPQYLAGWSDPRLWVMTKRFLSTLQRFNAKALLFSSMNLLKRVRRRGV